MRLDLMIMSEFRVGQQTHSFETLTGSKCERIMMNAAVFRQSHSPDPCRAASRDSSPDKLEVSIPHFYTYLMYTKRQVSKMSNDLS